MRNPTTRVDGKPFEVTEFNHRRIDRMEMPPGTVVETGGQQCELIDVSALGAQLQSQAAIRPSQALELAWRRNGRLVEAKGVVVWAQARLSGPSLMYRAGVQFHEPVSLRDTGFVDEDFGLPA